MPHATHALLRRSLVDYEDFSARAVDHSDVRDAPTRIHPLARLVRHQWFPCRIRLRRLLRAKLAERRHNRNQRIRQPRRSHCAGRSRSPAASSWTAAPVGHAAQAGSTITIAGTTDLPGLRDLAGL